MGSFTVSIGTRNTSRIPAIAGILLARGVAVDIPVPPISLSVHGALPKDRGLQAGYCASWADPVNCSSVRVAGSYT
jgi:hypothetical protein